MKQFKLACILPLFAAGLVQANTPCDGFEIKIKNKLADNLLVTKIALNGAEIHPGGIQKIDGQNSQTFTVNGSADNVPMHGDMVFRTLSLPSKEVKIRFNLENSGLVCQHTDIEVQGNDYAVDKIRLPGGVDYSIFNK